MKLTSRKFWVCVASILASIGTSVAGLATSEKWIAMVGIVCTVLSSAIYAGCEAYVDGVRAGLNEGVYSEIDEVRVDSDGLDDDLR